MDRIINKNNPIGIFDSGIGGVTVMNEIVRQLPNESIFYYADTTNCPYGNKIRDEIIHLSENNTEFLLEMNCKMIVVACNTATGAAINHLRKKYSIPFVGIEPATKPAARQTKTGNIGVLATEHTFETDHFNSTKNNHANHINVHTIPGIGLVELIESNKIDSQEMQSLLKKYFLELAEKNIDSLVLGCTHYPLLIPIINHLISDKIRIFNPAPSVAKQVEKVLKDADLMSLQKTGNYHFSTSGNKNKLMELLALYFPNKFSIG